MSNINGRCSNLGVLNLYNNRMWKFQNHLAILDLLEIHNNNKIKFILKAVFETIPSTLQIWNRTTRLFWMAILIWECPRGNKVMGYCKWSRNKHRCKLTAFHIEICRQAVSFFYSFTHLFHLCCSSCLGFLVLCKCQSFSYIFSTVPLSIYISKLKDMLYVTDHKETIFTTEMGVSVKWGGSESLRS